MRPIRTKISLLLAALSLSLCQPTEGVARSRKTAKTSVKAKTSGSKSSQKKGRSSSSKKATAKASSSRRGKSTYNIRSRARYRNYAAQAPTEEQLEQMRQDSIRLRTGGTTPTQKVSEKVALPNELLTTRFRRADSTLTRSEIRELYFTIDEREDTAPFLSKIESEADRLIEAHSFGEALKTVQQGLWRTPTHIGLIKRACDLALHLKNSKFNTYMYQLVELLSMIAHTGDGSSFDKAIQVRSLSDALLFEQHWNETPREQILASKEQSSKGKNYVLIEVQTDKGKSEAHYYLIHPSEAKSTTTTKKQ